MGQETCLDRPRPPELFPGRRQGRPLHARTTQKTSLGAYKLVDHSKSATKNGSPSLSQFLRHPFSKYLFVDIQGERREFCTFLWSCSDQRGAFGRKNESADGQTGL